ncbi:MAG: YihY/virulence factor BrkB family protein [Armatimonadetes bacterium]|nr:YihY/virulence factor BrkB family protein [Anaerolineae bacterium]
MLKQLFELIQQTLAEWNADRGSRLAAALAYYTVFSLAPLLVVVIAIVGFVVNQDTVRAEILQSVTSAVGTDAATFVEDLLVNANRPTEGIVSTIIGILTLILGAAGAFGQLQDALNTIWDVKDPVLDFKANILTQIKAKLFGFGMVLMVGFLLLVSLVISTALSALNTYLTDSTAIVAGLANALSTLISFGVVMVLFALIFKYLPRIKVEWRDVWVGAALTALLFSVGKFLLGLYLANSGAASIYGAAGSFVLILLWVYYSAQVLLLGAEFTQVYTRRYGSQAAPGQAEQAIQAAEAALPT